MTSRSSDSFIACEHVSQVFQTAGRGQTVALDDVNLQVPRGQFVCLLGPSGCGKTTLLNLIAGFMKPTSGTIRVDAKPVGGPGPDRGVVFQDYSLFSWLTVEGNVNFGPRMTGVDQATQRELSERYLRMVGLSGFANKYPFELSGGMKQRVAIARSLVMRPDVLLMDEPFAALDAMTRGSLQSELLEIQRAEEKTIVFVTHNIGEAIFLADLIVLMSPHPGRIQEVHTVDIPQPRARTNASFNELYEHLENAIGTHSVE